MLSYRLSHTTFTNLSQYQIVQESEISFHGDRLRELPDPIPARDEIIPDPDSIPLTILNHPLGTKLEAPTAAFEEPIPPIPSGEGPDAV